MFLVVAVTTKQAITAVIYDKRGRVLSIGRNNYVKTHPYQAQLAHSVGLPHKTFLHAEVDAILRCRNIDRAHRIMVTRVNRNGEYVLAKPCPICASAIAAAGIKYVEHT